MINAQLLYLESVDPKADISIYINSPGGSVYDGLSIYDTMQIITPKIKTVNMGLAASMGSIILCGGTKGMRYGLKHSRVMIHQPWGGAEGQTSDIEITTREFQKLKKELYEILSVHSGMSLETIARDADRDYWMDSIAAKKYGLIDHILNRKTKK
jgi:ATP-dependent Clp protease protease subunit